MIKEIKGVIYGIPLTIEMKELVRNLKEKCDSFQSATRLTMGVEKKETQSVSFGAFQLKGVAYKTILDI